MLTALHETRHLQHISLLREAGVSDATIFSRRLIQASEVGAYNYNLRVGRIAGQGLGYSQESMRFLGDQMEAMGERINLSTFRPGREYGNYWSMMEPGKPSIRTVLEMPGRF